jgi:HK97 family phage prohead protease
MSVSTLSRRTRAKELPRELRRFRVKEVRAKSTSDTEIDIEGYASVTDEPYELEDWLGTYSETIQSGAFKKTLQEKDDVRLLFNHDGIPLARTKSGTLELKEDDTGLKVNATLDNRLTTANDVFVAIERGDLDEMSFAFKVTKQYWDEDYTERTIVEVKLFDVSVVTYPANPATSVKLRAMDFMLNELSDDDVKDFIERYSRRITGSKNAEKLALRRRQLAMLDLR